MTLWNYVLSREPLRKEFEFVGEGGCVGIKILPFSCHVFKKNVSQQKKLIYISFFKKRRRRRNLTSGRLNIASFMYGMLRLFIKKKVKLHTRRVKKFGKVFANRFVSLFFFSIEDIVSTKLLILLSFTFSFVHVYVSCF